MINIISNEMDAATLATKLAVDGHISRLDNMGPGILVLYGERLV